jgi:hypothetical protein
MILGLCQSEVLNWVQNESSLSIGSAVGTRMGAFDNTIWLQRTIGPMRLIQFET